MEASSSLEFFLGMGAPLCQMGGPVPGHLSSVRERGLFTDMGVECS